MKTQILTSDFNWDQKAPWWLSKHVGVILSVLMCDIWINVLLQTGALVGPLHIVNWNAKWNSEMRNVCYYKVSEYAHCLQQVQIRLTDSMLVVWAADDKLFIRRM
jgi:hypothetical protein